MKNEQILILATIFGPLLGAIVGGLIAYLTNRNMERQRLKLDRQEKFAGLRREALTAALEWIEPMRNAETKASSAITYALRGNFDHSEFLKKFPYLLGDLVKRDLPANQRAVLPDRVYERGHKIIRELDELLSLGVKCGQESILKKMPMVGFRECSEKLTNIRDNINSLETDLQKEFRHTFK